MDISLFSVNSSTIRDKDNNAGKQMQQRALFGAAELYMSCQKYKMLLHCYVNTCKTNLCTTLCFNNCGLSGSAVFSVIILYMAQLSEKNRFNMKCVF